MRDPSSYDISNLPETFRIFNRNDYGYYRSNMENIVSHVPSEEGASISLEQVYNEDMNEDRIKCIRKAYNVERHALEATDLRHIISENFVLQYLKNKKYIKDKWKTIEKANS